MTIADDIDVEEVSRAHDFTMVRSLSSKILAIAIVTLPCRVVISFAFYSAIESRSDPTSLREIAKLHVNDFHRENLRNARRRETCRGREAPSFWIG